MILERKVINMIKCNNKNKEEILEYIGSSYGECLYLYIDFLKYGLENENVHVWYQKEEEEIKALILQYYTGAHIFSKGKDFDVADAVALLKEINPSMICGMKWTLDKIEQYFDNYEMETGIVGALKDLRIFDTNGCKRADREEIKEIAELLATDDALGKPYGFDLLYKQLLERFDENFGRNYLYRRDGKIVATASTYAEAGGAAVISGVMVHPEYRGLGLSKNVLSAICEDLKSDGIDVFSYYYIPSATRMHEAVGFKPLGDWAKLVRE